MIIKKIIFGMITFSLFTAYAEDITLRISWWGGAERHEKTIQALKVFEERYPHIKIKREYGGWQGHEEKVMTQMVGNTAPDVMQINWGWLNIYSKDGKGYYDLNNLKDVIDISNYNKELLEQVTVNGKLNAIPMGLSGKVFYYNKSTYDKAGLPIPKSFDDMITSAKIFQEKFGKGTYPFYVDDYGYLLLIIYKLEQESGKSFIQNNKLNFTESQLAESAKFFTKLVKEGAFTPVPERAAAGSMALHQTPAWIEGRYAGTYEWDSAAPIWRDSLSQNQELVVGDYITQFGPYSSTFNKIGMAFAINKNTRYPKESAMLLNFLISDPEAVKILGISRGVPANKSAVKTLKESNLLGGIILEANDKVIKFGGNPMHSLFDNKKITAEMRVHMEKLLYGQITEEEMAKGVVVALENFLKKSK